MAKKPAMENHRTRLKRVSEERLLGVHIGLRLYHFRFIEYLGKLYTIFMGVKDKLWGKSPSGCNIIQKDCSLIL